MSVRIRINFNHLDDIAARSPEAAAMLVDKTLLDIEADATAHCPVGETGNLKNNRSWRVASATRKAVRWNAHYAAYVNFGTRYMAARPFVTNAVNAVMPSAQQAADEIARNLGL
jgi:HK97 gp10 family phage protein